MPDSVLANLEPPQLEQPFTAFLTEPLRQQAPQVSGWAGAPGNLLHIADQFLGGMTKGRIMNYLQEEAGRRQEISTFIKYGQSLLEDPNLTPEARQAIQQRTALTIAELSQGDKKGKKGAEGDGGPLGAVGGVLKNIIVGMAGGNVPKSKGPINMKERIGELTTIVQRQGARQDYWLNQATPQIEQVKQDLIQQKGGAQNVTQEDILQAAGHAFQIAQENVEPQRYAQWRATVLEGFRKRGGPMEEAQLRMQQQMFPQAFGATPAPPVVAGAPAGTEAEQFFQRTGATPAPPSAAGGQMISPGAAEAFAFGAGRKPTTFYNPKDPTQTFNAEWSQVRGAYVKPGTNDPIPAEVANWPTRPITTRAPSALTVDQQRTAIQWADQARSVAGDDRRKAREWLLRQENLDPLVRNEAMRIVGPVPEQRLAETPMMQDAKRLAGQAFTRFGTDKEKALKWIAEQDVDPIVKIEAKRQFGGGITADELQKLMEYISGGRSAGPSSPAPPAAAGSRRSRVE